MPSSNSHPLVQILHVTYTHWNQTEPTLRDLSLELGRGTLSVLVGPSGSGKSTLCGLFNGVIPHLHGGKLEGDVLVDGVNTRSVEVKDLARKVGILFQDPETMFATLCVEDEIAFGPECLCLPADLIRETVEQMLDLTQLGQHRLNQVWDLSGGQVQKLGLASVLAMRPDLIILDEPTANLDPASTRAVHELVLAMRDQGITALLVTREMDELLAQADQLIVVEGGHVLAAGSPREVIRAHGEYLVNSLGVWLPETVEIAVGLGLIATGLPDPPPITVEETVDLLERRGLLVDEIQAKAATSREPSSGEVLIAARDLEFHYPDGTAALKGASLDIRRGEMLAIVGRNGAGKSTLAKLMVGLLRPQAGELMLFGKPARRWTVRSLANQVALVLQSPEHQVLTDRVIDEIGYSLVAKGVRDPAEVERLSHQMLRLLGLEQEANVHPFALSAGLKRRLGVATMLVGDPKILLVDEPTYGQDKEMTRTLMELMEEIRSRGIAVVMITHDMRLVQEYAERVVVMSDGRVLFDGPTSALFDRGPLLAEANLRPTMLHELLNAMRARGARIRGDVRRTSDLLQAWASPRVGARNGRT